MIKNSRIESLINYYKDRLEKLEVELKDCDSKKNIAITLSEICLIREFIFLLEDITYTIED